MSVEDGATRYSLAVGVAFLFALFFLFALQALPGIPRSRDILIVLTLISMATSWNARGFLVLSKLLTREVFLLVALLTVASILRFSELGTAELQGDEARAMILASGVSSGEQGILFMHKKGPAEALFAAPSMLLTGTSNEFSARLGFSLAGIASILALYALVRGFDPKRYTGAALFAASFLCLDGFHIAFSRIVQYQSLLVFFLICAALCATEIKNAANQAQRYASACAVFCAAALLCHYDAALAFPAIALVLWHGLRMIGQTPGQIARSLALPGLQFAVLSASFYLPFFLSEHFAATAGYLSQRIGANKLPTNNLPRYFDLLSFYSGIYQASFVYAVLVVAILVWLRKYASSQVAALLGATAFGLLIINPLPTWSFLFLALPLVLLISTPAAPFPVRVFCLWSWCGLSVLGFFFARPNTHFYVVHPANAALAGIFLSEIYSWLHAQKYSVARIAFTTLMVALAVVTFNYLRVAYLSPNIEYRFAYAKARPLLFPETFESGLPAGAYFGFQHRSGWKTIGALMQSGDIDGSYDSNEEELITAWYTRGAQRVTQDPVFYFVVTRAKDPVKIPRSKIENEYAFWGRVYVDDRRSLDIYRRTKSTDAPRRLEAKNYESAFDHGSALVLKARNTLLTAVSR